MQDSDALHASADTQSCQNSKYVIFILSKRVITNPIKGEGLRGRIRGVWVEYLARG